MDADMLADIRSRGFAGRGALFEYTDEWFQEVVETRPKPSSRPAGGRLLDQRSHERGEHFGLVAVEPGGTVRLRCSTASTNEWVA